MWGCIKAPLGSSLVPKAFLWGHSWMGERGLKRFLCGPSFQSSAMLARVIFRVALKSDHGGSSCMWGCIKAPWGVHLYPKPSSGGTLGWSKGNRNAFSEARVFSLLPLR